MTDITVSRYFCNNNSSIGNIVASQSLFTRTSQCPNIGQTFSHLNSLGYFSSLLNNSCGGCRTINVILYYCCYYY